MLKVTHIFLILGFLLVYCYFAPKTLAQSVCVIKTQIVDRDIKGRVVFNNSVNIIAGAKVKLVRKTKKNKRQEVIHRTNSDKNGWFEINSMKNGKYILLVSKPHLEPLYIPIKVKGKQNGSFLSISMNGLIGEPCGGGEVTTLESLKMRAKRKDIKTPTVQIEYVCQNASQVWLKLVNKTNGSIGIKTFTMYSLPNNSGKFDYMLKKGRKQVTLSNGLIVTTVPSDDDMVNPLYFVEEEQIVNNKKLFMTKVYGNVGAESFIASQDSVLFWVQLKDLNESSEVYINYQYEWEYTGLSLNSSVPEHRAYFRGVTLANLDQIKCERPTP